IVCRKSFSTLTMKKLVIALLVAMAILPNFFFTAKEKEPPSKKVEEYFKKNLASVIKQLSELQRACAKHKDRSELKRVFFRARMAFKKTECLIAYYYPHLLRIINGPALPFAEGENSLSVQPPHGFQVMEEMLFSDSNK